MSISKVPLSIFNAVFSCGCLLISYPLIFIVCSLLHQLMTNIGFVMNHLTILFYIVCFIFLRGFVLPL